MSTSTYSRLARTFRDYALLRRTRESRDPAVIDGVCRQVFGDVPEMLDIGCSDGRLASQIAARLSAQPMGVDVQLQPRVRIPAQRYDGRHLPFSDDRFHLVTILDVLHHAEDPASVLSEAVRVLHPDGVIVIKDHVRRGAWSNQVLRWMDSVSNSFEHDITTGKYLSLPEWSRLIAQSSGELLTFETPFRVHGLPWRLVARDAYHCIIAVGPPR